MMLTRKIPIVLISLLTFAVVTWWLLQYYRASSIRYRGMAVIPVRLWSGVLVNEESVLGARLVVDTGSSVIILMHSGTDCSGRQGRDKTYNYGTARFTGKMVTGKLPIRPDWEVTVPWLCPTSGSDSVGVWGLCNNNSSTAEASFVEAIAPKGAQSMTLGVNFRDMWVAFRPAQEFVHGKIKSRHMLPTINPANNSVNRPYVPLSKLTVGGFEIKVQGGQPIAAIFDTGTSYPLVFCPPKPRGISVDTALSMPAIDFTFTAHGKRYRTHCPSSTSANPAVGSHGLQFITQGNTVTLGAGSFVIVGCPALLCMGDIMNVHMQRSGLLRVSGYEFINIT